VQSKSLVVVASINSINQLVMEKLSNLNVFELDKHQLKKIEGGGPIFEGIAWLYGFAHGALERNAQSRDWDDVDWERKQVLVGG
jgi:hypothetical protein